MIIWIAETVGTVQTCASMEDAFVWLDKFGGMPDGFCYEVATALKQDLTLWRGEYPDDEDFFVYAQAVYRDGTYGG